MKQREWTGNSVKHTCFRDNRRPRGRYLSFALDLRPQGYSPLDPWGSRKKGASLYSVLALLMHYEGLAGLSTSPATIKTTRLVVKLSLEIQDITCPCIDTNFIFERSTQYLTSEHSKRVRYRVEHEKIKFVSTSRNVIFCLLQKHTNDNIFNDFPKISNHISEHYPMIAEDDRRRSEDVSIIHQQI